MSNFEPIQAGILAVLGFGLAGCPSPFSSDTLTGEVLKQRL